VGQCGCGTVRQWESETVDGTVKQWTLRHRYNEAGTFGQKGKEADKLVQLGGGRVGQWTVWLVGDSGMQWAVGHGLVYWWDRQTLNQWDRAPVWGRRAVRQCSEKLGRWRVGQLGSKVVRV
jgi:hypothetical protein